MTRMKYKLIAADIDGTLLNPEREITPLTKAAVTRCMESGARFVLSSGRMPQALAAIGAALNVNAPAVCFNGGTVVDLASGRTLFSTPLEYGTAMDIARYLESAGVYFHAFIHSGYIAPRYDPILTAGYEQLCGVKARVVNGPVSEFMDEAPMKLLVVGTPESAAAILPELQARFSDRANIMQSQKHLIECVGKQTSKARALEFLREYLSVRPEETCAFGDGMNDLEMLIWAHKPYVMNNASDRLKNADPRFTTVPSNAENGVARTLLKDLEENA